MNNIISYGEDAIKIKDTLELARKTYGYKNQLMVCIEELNELSSIIAKIPRYDSIDDAMQDIKDRIIDEVADVLIILDHILEICDIDTPCIHNQIKLKISRLRRWLKTSNKISQTMIDREIYEDVNDEVV